MMMILLVDFEKSVHGLKQHVTINTYPVSI